MGTEETLMETVSADCIFIKDTLLGLYADIQSHNSVFITRKDSERDVRYLLSRYNTEGLSFLTKVLPLLDAALLRGLETGFYTCPTNVKTRGALPLLLRGLHKRVFNADGTLCSSPDPVAIRDLRQFFSFYKKARIGFSDKVIGELLDEFVAVDAALPLTFEGAPALVQDVLESAREDIGALFNGFDPYEITPRHGPGATAGKQLPHEKRKPTTRYKQLDEGGYPFYGYFFAGAFDLLLRIADFRNAKVADYGTARVILVPKDSRGPRIISAEPLEYQFLQQGLQKKLYAHIESHSLTRGFVNFTDQSVNREAARLSSIDGSLVTMDLKEASDRVSVALVKELFDGPVLRALLALRTPETLLPDGRVIPLRKYAPMGSALCFPVEALCFYFLAKHLRLKHSGHLRNFTCYVYGDDIISDPLTAFLVRKYFPLFGLKLNQDKCFSDGKFRESCGLDAYEGIDVTPHRLRVIPDKKAGTPEDILSLEATMNQLWDSCYYRCSEVFRRYLERKLKTRLIPKLPESAHVGLALSRFPLPTKGLRYCRKRCAWLAKCFALRTSSYKKEDSDGLTDNRELFRKYTQGWSPDYREGVYTRRGRTMLTRKFVSVLA